MMQVATIHCSTILRSLLAICACSTAAAFASRKILSNSPTSVPQFSVRYVRQLWTHSSQRPFFNGGIDSSASLGSLPPASELRAIPRVFGTIEWNDVLYDDTSTAFDAWEWTNGMGAPAAFIAAAVLVTLAETRLEMAPRREDMKWVRFVKRFMRLLLMSSFGSERASIFVGSMTGSMLLGHGPQTAAEKIVGYQSPLQLLHHHHEMEYLFTQISFLQGLIHWLAAVVCQLIIPLRTETKSAKRMNRCLASWLITLIFSILAFYNHHVNFYSDYLSMIRRFLFLWVGRQRFRPMSLLCVPSFFISSIITWKAFTSPPEED